MYRHQERDILDCDRHQERDILDCEGKVIFTTRVEKQKIKNPKMESEHLWNNFADAKRNVVADNRLTDVSTEEVFLDRPKVIDSAIKGSDATKNGGVFLKIQCRICQGDHWTASCLLKKFTPFQDYSSYIPPSQRSSLQRRINSGSTRRSSENLTVRVSNFSRDANADDLRDLFNPFGALTSVFLAVDWYTGLSKGFGFVSFVNKDDAQRAIDSLHAYGYESLILHVEWSE